MRCRSSARRSARDRGGDARDDVLRASDEGDDRPDDGAAPRRAACCGSAKLEIHTRGEVAAAAVRRTEANPVPHNVVQQLEWQRLDAWRLPLGGLVAHPMTLTLADLKARERRAVTCTLECSGNTGLPFFTGLTPLL